MIASAVDREPATHPRNGSVVHSRRCGFESEDPPSDEKHIQLTLAIYTEAVDPPGVVRVLEQRPERKVLLNVPGHASHDADASDEPLEVREDESPTERGSPFTSVDIPAYDGRSYVVAVFQTGSTVVSNATVFIGQGRESGGQWLPIGTPRIH